MEISDVLDEFEKRFHIDMGDTQPMHAAFLERQQEVHAYDLDEGKIGQRSLDLLLDKMYIFAILMRRRGVQKHYLGDQLILTDKNLEILASQGSNEESWQDPVLWRLFDRRDTQRKRNKLQSYTDIIDEIGTDPEVVLLWGRQLTYEDTQKTTPKKKAQSEAYERKPHRDQL